MIFSGKKLLDLKATHGMPLDTAVERVLSEDLVIDWSEFVDTARINGWWDFKTISVIQVALEDADISRTLREGILSRVKVYMLEHPIDF